MFSNEIFWNGEAGGDFDIGSTAGTMGYVPLELVDCCTVVSADRLSALSNRDWYRGVSVDESDCSCSGYDDISDE